MNINAILALIGDLYGQVVELQSALQNEKAENQQLKESLAKIEKQKDKPEFENSHPNYGGVKNFSDKNEESKPEK